jgi:hypothetical protein
LPFQISSYTETVLRPKNKVQHQIGMRRRLPDNQSILQVYAVIAVVFAGWTITAFAWKLPSWLLLLNLGEIFTVFSYAMAANFVESLIVLALLLVLCILLPRHILRDDFVPRGTILSLGLLGSLLVFVGFETQFGFENGLRLLIPPAVVLVATVFILKSGALRSTAVWLADRLTVFLFLLLPLFVTLSLYVIFRNVA